MQSTVLRSLQFGFYCVIKPFKGYYQLKYEKKGTLQAGGIFILLLYLSTIFKTILSGYIFNPSKGSPINLFIIFAQTVAFFGFFCVSNWCLTLLLDGEGTMGQIAMGLCYTSIPIITSNVLVTVLSNFLSADEGMYIAVIQNTAWLLTAFLIVIAVMQINQYSFVRSVVSCVLSLVGIAVILFICLLVFNLVQQVLTFAESIYKEIAFRI